MICNVPMNLTVLSGEYDNHNGDADRGDDVDDDLFGNHLSTAVS